MTASELPGLDPLDLSDFPALQALEEVDFDDDGSWVAHGELPDDGVEWTYPKCPNPTRWKVVGASRARGALRIVSPAISAKAAPITYRFTVTRSLTFGASIESSVTVGIPLLEAETGVTLNTSVTIQTGESVTITVPKGATMALFGGCGYIVRTVQRTVYGSAMCNPVLHSAVVRSPQYRILEVRNV